MFDLMYGALQFYAYHQSEPRYAELFSVVTGLVYSAGERSHFRDFHQHVDHFKAHAGGLGGTSFNYSIT